MTHEAALGGPRRRRRCRGRRSCPPASPRWRCHERGRTLAQAGILGVREGPSRHDPETLELLFDTIRRQVNPDHGLKRATTFQWEFTDPDVPTWHLTVNNGSSTVAEGEAPHPDLRMRLSYQDFADIVGERLDPRARSLSRPPAPPRQPARARPPGEGLPGRLRRRPRPSSPARASSAGQPGWARGCAWLGAGSAPAAGADDGASGTVSAAALRRRAVAPAARPA